MGAIKAVLFDWDFTMGATCGDVGVPERLEMLLTRLGLSYGRDAIGEAVTRHKEQYLTAHGGASPRLQTREEWLRYYVELLELLGHSDALEEIAGQMFDEYARLPFNLYPDVHPVLQELTSRGYPIGIVSNHSTNIRPKMNEEVGRFIPQNRIVISGEIGIYKPEPGIFLEGAKIIGAPPENLMYVGDNLDVDAKASVQAAGFACGLWIDRSGNGAGKEFPDNVYRITALTQALEYL